MRFVSYLLGTVLCGVALFSLHQAGPLDEGLSTFGTLIAAFGNSNGIVVITDSMVSVRNGSGTHQLPSPGQKLLKYDNHTVCAIAGLGSASVPAAPELNADLLGIVASYRDEVRSKNIQQPIASALSGLSAALQYFLDGRAEINALTGKEKLISDYHLQLLLAGYDLDGVPKIGELVLAVEPQEEPGGVRRWATHEKQRKIIPIHKELIYAVGGMNDVASNALSSPQSFNGYQILETYREGKAKDGGASLSLDEMEQLGRAIVNLTADKHREVGGEKQVAVLQSSEIAKFAQPNFPPLKRPFSLFMVRNSSLAQGIAVRGDVVVFYESTQFNGSASSPFGGTFIPLDNSIFVNCLFRNTILQYNGGSLYFDEANQLIDSHLFLADGAFKRPDIVNLLQKRFTIQKQ